MTPRTARLARGVLLSVVVVVAALVARAITRAPASQASAPPPPAPEASGEPTVPRSDDVVIRRYEEDASGGSREKFVLRAKRMVGQEGEEVQLQGVELTFHYTRLGQRDTSTIKADQCFYTQKTEKAVFRGHVDLKTNEGFALQTEQLAYRSERGVARAEGPVSFQRKDLSGSAVGADYEAATGRIVLQKDVVIDIQDPDTPPTHIEAARAESLREEGLMVFEDAVRITYGPDVLTAGRLEVNFGPDQKIYRAQAQKDVVLKTAGETFPGTTTGPLAGGGARHLTARKLDIWYHPSGAMKEAVAGPDGELTLLPAPGVRPQERRNLKARFLAFRFDPLGRMEQLQAQHDASFRSEPVPPAQGSVRTITCEGFIATLDPATGSTRQVDFQIDVVFSEGKRRATGQKAIYDGTYSKLHLREKPSVIDEENATELRALAIDLDTVNGDIGAREEVRHLVKRRKAAGGAAIIGGGQQPALLSARFFEYKAAARAATYREGALLRSGEDEIRADTIVLQETAGQWRLEATGAVKSTLHPRAAKDPAAARAAPAAVVARADKMRYDEAKREIAYDGDAELQHGEMATKSPQATIVLGAEGGVQSLTAGEPVEVRNGTTTGQGSRAVYDPAKDSLELTGEKVTVTDPARTVSGRSVVMYLHGDRMLVDGREQGRTETVIRREP